MFDFNHWLNLFPGTNFHELNIDWLVQAVKELAKELQHFELVNQITYQGIWNITKQYPAWSVVTNNNDGYVSLQPVPVGVNITNSEYWTKISNFSQELADLGNRVITLEGVVNKLNGLRNNTTRKVICISDSYGLTPSVDSSWIANFKKYMGLSNSNFYRSQENGSGFIGYHSPSTTFLTQLQSIATGLSSDEKNAIDDIIIAGGWNDAQQYKNGAFVISTLGTAIQDCINYARNNFPNAKIWLSFLGWGCKNFDEHLAVRAVMNAYQQYSYMTNTRISYIDGINWIHRQALTAADGLHPNSAGADAIAKTITSVLMGGTVFCDMAPGSNGKIAPAYTAYDTNVDNLVITNMYQIYDSGVASMFWDKIEFDNLVAINHLNEIKIADFTDSIIQGGPGATNGAKFPCMLRYNGNMYNVFIIIHDNAIFLGNMSMTDIPANSSIEIFYGGGTADIFL